VARHANWKSGVEQPGDRKSLHETLLEAGMAIAGQLAAKSYDGEYSS